MSDILNQGITVTLGGHDYTIRALPIDKDLEWRKAVGKFFASSVTNIKGDDPREVFSNMVELIAGEGMDGIINSMFMLEGWDGLDLSTVTRGELTKAAMEVYEAYYGPFVTSLIEMAISIGPQYRGSSQPA